MVPVDETVSSIPRYYTAEMPSSPSAALIDAIVFALRMEEASSPQYIRTLPSHQLCCECVWMFIRNGVCACVCSTELFEVLSGFSDLGVPEMQYLMSPRIMGHLVDFYIGEYSVTQHGATTLYSAVRSTPCRRYCVCE